MGKFHFEETQRFARPWLIATLALPLIGIIVFVGYGLQQQLGFDGSFRNYAADDFSWLWGVALALVVSGLIFLGLVFLRLETRVTDEGILIRMPPLRHKRMIRFGEIRSVAARTYRPIREYGGWGMRLGPSGYAYNVSGNRGVQLEIEHGKPLLIGSQQADQLARLIRARLATDE